MQKKKIEIWAVLSGLLGGLSVLLIPLIVVASYHLIGSVPEQRKGMVYFPFFYSTILPVSLIAVIAGIIALRKIKKDSHLKGKLMAVTGIILGMLFPLIAYVVIKLLPLR